VNQRSLKSTCRNLGVNPYRALKRNGIRVGTFPSVEPYDVLAKIASRPLRHSVSHLLGAGWGEPARQSETNAHAD
jgi:predicted Fe-Mo cluster-binding NifX family protein